jgi:dipeptidyl aminopeptidase/acylaminoacyl peptidase
MTSRGVARGLVLATAMSVAIATGIATGAGAASRADSGKVPAPEGLPKFYAVPGNLPAKPGKLIKSERIKSPDLDGTLYRVMYTSTDLNDDAIAVTGLVAIPDGEAPKGGFPVVSWAHGTAGMADKCAPSIAGGGAAPETNKLLARGWVVVASDYQGLGTPGLHPYIAGENAARNTIDIVRAARTFKSANASSDYVIWGHSQGGHTALFGWKIAADYAPELTLHGVVAGAPPSQLSLLYTFLKDSSNRQYLFMAAGGLNAAYGDDAAPLDDVLTPKGIELLPELENGCLDYVHDLALGYDYDEIGTGDPYTVPAWKTIIDGADAQNFTDANDVPLLIIHGGEDSTIPPASSAILLDHLCTLGSTERWLYPGQEHADVIGPSLDDMVGWIDTRFAGSSDSVTPVGQPDVEVTTCDA